MLSFLRQCLGLKVQNLIKPEDFIAVTVGEARSSQWEQRRVLTMIPTGALINSACDHVTVCFQSTEKF